MLLGVLSVAGVIALAVPDTNPLPDSNFDAGADVAAGPPPSFSPSLPPPAQLPEPFDSEPVSETEFGAPSIDGKPMQPDFGMPFGASPQLTSSKGDTDQSNQGGFTPPVYVMPGSTPQPEGGDAMAPMEIPAQ